MDQYFFYTVDPNADEPIMLIDKHIGFDEADGFGIMGDAFQKELLALDAMDKKRIQVWINSPGGVVSDGYNIYNAILKSNTKVDTYCIGMAASIAGVIFQAGRNRIMVDYGWLMYHNPSGGSDMKGMEAITDSLAKMVSVRSGKTEDEVKTIMRKTSYIDAEEALAHGLCDKVESSSEQNKKRTVPVANDVKAFYRESSQILNNILKTQIQTPSRMKKVTNKLGLNEDANEESIVTAINSLETKNTELSTQLKTKDDEVKNKETELATAKAELEAANKKVTDMEAAAKAEAEAKDKKEKEDKEAEEKETAAKAKNMIEGFVAEGRIKNEEKVINEWIEDCKVLGLDKVKNRIESLPVNKTSVKLVVNKQGDPGKTDGKLTGVVRNTMATKLLKLQGAEV